MTIINMTPNIASAMIKIAQAVPQLGKADRNAFAKYNYVSIDKYYETIAKLSAANGIGWQAYEVDNKLLPEIGKDGALRITYAFDLYHESGDMIRAFTAFTIYLSLGDLFRQCRYLLWIRTWWDWLSSHDLHHLRRRPSSSGPGPRCCNWISSLPRPAR